MISIPKVESRVGAFLSKLRRINLEHLVSGGRQERRSGARDGLNRGGSVSKERLIKIPKPSPAGRRRQLVRIVD